MVLVNQILFLIGLIGLIISDLARDNSSNEHARKVCKEFLVGFIFFLSGSLLTILNVEFLHDIWIVTGTLIFYVYSAIFIFIGIVDVKTKKPFTSTSYITKYDQKLRQKHFLLFFISPDLLVLDIDPKDKRHKFTTLSDIKLSSSADRLYDQYKKIFRGASEEILEQYKTIIKSDYEIWLSWSSTIPTLLTPIIVGLVSSWVAILIATSLSSKSPNYIVNLVIVICTSLFAFAPIGIYPLRKVALKRAKAALFLELAADSLQHK